MRKINPESAVPLSSRKQREREFHLLSSSFIGVRSSLSEPRRYIFVRFSAPLGPAPPSSPNGSAGPDRDMKALLAYAAFISFA